MSRGIDRTNGSTASRAEPHADVVEGARLVVVTRHEVIAAGLESLLRTGGHRIVAHLTGGEGRLDCLQSNRPHAVLLYMSTREAVTLISQLRGKHASVAIILMLEEQEAITAASLLELDIEGIVLGAACATSLLNCVDAVRHGRRWVDPDLLRHLAQGEEAWRAGKKLTQREADVAGLVSHGLHNKQIARELHLSEGTVKMHLHHIYEKLHVRGRTELALSVAVRAEDGLAPAPARLLSSPGSIKGNEQAREEPSRGLDVRHARLRS
jgi:two-component system, NarL family, nitrate/nitrite response regulator NarL